MDSSAGSNLGVIVAIAVLIVLILQVPRFAKKTSQDVTMSAASQPATHAAQGTFKIRYVRLTIALVALLGLLAAIATAITTATGLTVITLPLSLFAMSVAALATLRVLAIRDRVARRRRSRQHSLHPSAFAKEHKQGNGAPKKGSKAFDVEQAGSTAQSADKPASKTAAEQETAQAATQPAVKPEPVKPAQQGQVKTWNPVQLPKPNYVDAPKAERKKPAPLNLAAEPKPTAKVKLSEGAQGSGAAGSASDSQALRLSPNTGKINLDEVLQRRRA